MKLTFNGNGDSPLPKAPIIRAIYKAADKTAPKNLKVDGAMDKAMTDIETFHVPDKMKNYFSGNDHITDFFDFKSVVIPENKPKQQIKEVTQSVSSDLQIDTDYRGIDEDIDDTSKSSEMSVSRILYLVNPCMRIYEQFNKKVGATKRSDVPNVKSISDYINPQWFYQQLKNHEIALHGEKANLKPSVHQDSLKVCSRLVRLTFALNLIFPKADISKLRGKLRNKIVKLQRPETINKFTSDVLSVCFSDKKRQRLDVETSVEAYNKVSDLYADIDKHESIVLLNEDTESKRTSEKALEEIEESATFTKTGKHNPQKPGIDRKLNSGEFLQRIKTSLKGFSVSDLDEESRKSFEAMVEKLFLDHYKTNWKETTKD